MATIPSTDKFFTHSADVNTVIGGPASAQEQSHWYTIDDLKESVLPYKVYTALLTQSGTSAPTAVVLQNTIGTVTLAYNGTGGSRILCGTSFPLNKTTVSISNPTTSGGVLTGTAGGFNAAAGVIVLNTKDLTGASANSLLNKTLVEVRVYN